MISTPTMMTALPAEHRDRVMRIAHEVNFPRGTRLFNEGGRADRFWIIRTGAVALDLHVPGRRAPIVETLGQGELIGWSWLFPPYVWQLGAEAVRPLRTYEFEASAVRAMAQDDMAFGSEIAQWVGKVLAHRLQATRIRLLDLYAPHGSGTGARG